MADDLAVIVDENDQVVGHKPHNGRTYDDIYRVSALWLTNSQDQVLMAQRKLDKDRDPGKWGPAVAGTVDQGESYEDNIYKEAEEEIGLTGVKFSLGPKRFNDRPGRYRYFCQWFLGTVDWSVNQFTIQEEEVEQIAWIDRDQLKQEIITISAKYINSAGNWSKMFLS